MFLVKSLILIVTPLDRKNLRFLSRYSSYVFDVVLPRPIVIDECRKYLLNFFKTFFKIIKKKLHIIKYARIITIFWNWIIKINR